MNRQRPDVLRLLVRFPASRVAVALASSLAIAALLFSLISPTASAEERWQAIRARGLWRVGIDPGVYPFSFYGRQGWDGFDAELMRELSRRVGLDVHAVPVGYDGFYDAIIAGHVDLAMSALVADPARTADFRFSQPYADVGLRVISPATSPVRDVGDLRGRCVAAALGSEGDRAARRLERRVPRMTRQVAMNEDDAIAQMLAGRCDAAIVSGPRALNEGCPLFDHRPLRSRIHCFILQSKPYVVAFSSQDQRAVEVFNALLGEMMADGTLERIAQRWFNGR